MCCVHPIFNTPVFRERWAETSIVRKMSVAENDALESKLLSNTLHVRPSTTARFFVELDRFSLSRGECPPMLHSLVRLKAELVQKKR